MGILLLILQTTLTAGQSATSCRRDWTQEGSYCYKIRPKTGSNNDAVGDCDSYGAFVATPFSQQGNAFMYAQMRRNKWKTMHMGIKHRWGKQNSWKLILGSKKFGFPISYMNWEAGIAHTQLQRPMCCAKMGEEGKWSKISCKGQADGWLCMTCTSTRFSPDCSKTCDSCAGLGMCSISDGRCLDGCRRGGNVKFQCNGHCDQGHYGDTCSAQCSATCRVPYTCRVGDGRCAGCLQTLYGLTCNMTCDKNCRVRIGDTCDQETGICRDGCEDGFYGPSCSSECPRECGGRKRCGRDDGSCLDGCTRRYYGRSCDQKCSDHCEGSGECARLTGFCLDGCDLGYQPDDCVSKCLQGSYGINCSKQCHECKENKTTGMPQCSHKHGICQGGCGEGYSLTGSKACVIKLSRRLFFLVAVFLPVMIVIVILLVIWLVLLKMKNRIQVEDEAEESVNLESVKTDRVADSSSQCNDSSHETPPEKNNGNIDKASHSGSHKSSHSDSGSGSGSDSKSGSGRDSGSDSGSGRDSGSDSDSDSGSDSVSGRDSGSDNVSGRDSGSDNVDGRDSSSDSAGSRV